MKRKSFVSKATKSSRENVSTNTKRASSASTAGGGRGLGKRKNTWTTINNGASPSQR